MIRTLPEVRPAKIKSLDRSTEMEWLKAHRSEYFGKWIALFGDELVSSGTDAMTVFSDAKKKGFERALIIHVVDHEPFAGGWS